MGPRSSHVCETSTRFRLLAADLSNVFLYANRNHTGPRRRRAPGSVGPCSPYVGVRPRESVL